MQALKTDYLCGVGTKQNNLRCMALRLTTSLPGFTILRQIKY